MCKETTRYNAETKPQTTDPLISEWKVRSKELCNDYYITAPLLNQ